MTQLGYKRKFYPGNKDLEEVKFWHIERFLLFFLEVLSGSSPDGGAVIQPPSIAAQSNKAVEQSEAFGRVTLNDRVLFAGGPCLFLNNYFRIHES